MVKVGAAAVAACALGFGIGMGVKHEQSKEQQMELGKFSVSLAVKDLAKSRAFYETLGFKETVVNADQDCEGSADHKWLILSNGSTTIGLFERMFEDNILTFNPGWSGEGEPLASFEDVRSIQEKLKTAGVELQLEADPASTGPAHIVMTDPDGNQIMLDQHVDKPAG